MPLLIASVIVYFFAVYFKSIIHEITNRSLEKYRKTLFIPPPSAYWAFRSNTLQFQTIVSLYILIIFSIIPSTFFIQLFLPSINNIISNISLTFYFYHDKSTVPCPIFNFTTNNRHSHWYSKIYTLNKFFYRILPWGTY